MEQDEAVARAIRELTREVALMHTTLKGGVIAAMRHAEHLQAIRTMLQQAQDEDRAEQARARTPVITWDPPPPTEDA